MRKSGLEKTWAWVIKGALLLVLVMPLYVSQGMLFPFITGKNFFFRFFIEIAFALWIGLAFWKSEYRPRLTLLFKAVTLFIVVLFFADLFSPNPARAFFSNFERMEGFMMLFHLYLYFVLLVSMLKTKRDWLVFFHATLAVSVLVGFVGLLQKFGYRISAQGGYRIDSTIGNPAYLASYLLFHVWLLGLLLRIYWEKWWLRLTYGFLMAFEIALIYLTATRGAVLAMLAGAILLLFLAVLFGKSAFANVKQRKLALVLLIAVMALPIILWSARKTQFVRSQPALNRLVSISFSDTTTKSRFSIWQMSLKGAMERPILGWGQENYYLVFQKYFDPRLATQEPWFDRSHNIILDWLVHAGIIGLVSFLSIIGVALWGIGKAIRKSAIDFWIGAILGVIFVAHFLENLFVFDNLNTYLLFFGFLGFTHYSLPAAGKDAPRTDDSRKNPGLALSAALVVLALVSGYFLHWQPIMASRNLIQALVGGQSVSLGETEKHFRDALAFNSFADTEIREQLGNTARGFLINKQSSTEERKAFTVFAVEELRKEILRPAKDVKHMLFLASILGRASEFDPGYMPEAENLLREAIALSSTKQIIYFELAQLYLSQNRLDDALALMQKAAALDTSYQQAVVNLAILGQVAGKKEVVDEALKFVRTEELDEDSLTRVSAIHQQRGDFKAAKDIFAKLIEVNPQNPQYRATGAALFAQFGEIDRAIHEAETAALLDAGFAKEADVFLKQLRAMKSNQ